MNSWINLTALWEIVVVGLVAGAGLPALFAIGMVALGRKGGTRVQAAVSGGSGGANGTVVDGTAESDSLVGGSVPGMVAAALCFLIVLAAIGWAIFAVYQSGHPHK
jgi:hypothetical protein